MSIAVLSNVNLFKVCNVLKKKMDVCEPNGYGNWIQPLLQGKIESEYVVCILDGSQLFAGLECIERYQDAEKLVESYIGYLELAIQKNPTNCFIISDVDILPSRVYSIKESGYLLQLEKLWFDNVQKLVERFDNVYMFPLKQMIVQMGRKEAYSKKMWYLASSPYSTGFEKELIKSIEESLHAIRGKRKKCLLLDLDNTLWGGVVGEEGIDGIALSPNKEGGRYYDFQKMILSIKEQGILLAILSKNNEEDVKEVFEKHPYMILKWDDFVGKRINWKPKAENLLQLQKELNIGLDSMVFIDDNPVEREAMKMACPEVEVPMFPENSCELSVFMEQVYREYFLAAEITQEDRVKTEVYQQNKQREDERNNHASLEDYLRMLQTRILVNRVSEDDIKRTVQLLQKTNQFNLTTKRYSEQEIRELCATKQFDLWIGSVNDRFGDNGKSILAIVERQGEKARIDTFIMSCRIMGRYAEDAFIDALEHYYREMGIDVLEAEFIPTAKNKPVDSFYERIGFSVIRQDEGGKKYRKKIMQSSGEYFADVLWSE